MKTLQQLNPESLSDNLAEAVAEYYHQQAKAQDYDPESLRLIHKDLSANLQSERRPPSRSDLKSQNRLAGRLKASVDFGQIDELMAGEIDAFLSDITRQCEKIHEALYASYITYGAETVL